MEAGLVLVLLRACLQVVVARMADVLEEFEAAGERVKVRAG